jgi:hypothetical protein
MKISPGDWRSNIQWAYEGLSSVSGFNGESAYPSRWQLTNVASCDMLHVHLYVSSTVQFPLGEMGCDCGTQSSVGSVRKAFAGIDRSLDHKAPVNL